MRETLSLAAELQLPKISSAEEREEYINNLLFKLGLVRFCSFNCISLYWHNSYIKETLDLESFR